MSETCFDQDAAQRETEERLETEAVNMIIERLLDLKPSLYWHYTREVCPPLPLNDASRSLNEQRLLVYGRHFLGRALFSASGGFVATCTSREPVNYLAVLNTSLQERAGEPCEFRTRSKPCESRNYFES